MQAVMQFVRDDSGQDLIEYVLLGSFISIAVMVGAQTLGGALNGWYESVAQWVGDASTEGPLGGGN